MKHLEQEYVHPKASTGEKVAGFLIVAIIAYLFIAG